MSHSHVRVCSHAKNGSKNVEACLIGRIVFLKQDRVFDANMGANKRFYSTLNEEQRKYLRRMVCERKNKCRPDVEPNVPNQSPHK